MRDTIASGIGSLLAVIASHVRRPPTWRTDAPHHSRTRVRTGALTEFGEERYFFFTATVFTAAQLGAEGVGHGATVVIGNGYVPGHAELTLDLLRRDRAVRELFEREYAR